MRRRFFPRGKVFSCPTGPFYNASFLSFPRNPKNGVTTVHFVSLFVQVLPESCILILFGILLGFTAFEIESQTSSTPVVENDAVVEKDASFSLDSNTFFFYLLPPIVLDAGLVWKIFVGQRFSTEPNPLFLYFKFIRAATSCRIVPFSTTLERFFCTP